MARALKVCSLPGCPELTDQGRCARHRVEAERRRGTAAQRGYGGRHLTFRQAVLRRDPICRIDGCGKPSTDADHWPLDKRELRARGMDEHDPQYGRGLCHSHHSKSTSVAQPGGWNAR